MNKIDFLDLIEQCDFNKSQMDRLKKYYSLDTSAIQAMNVLNRSWFNYIKHYTDNRSLISDPDELAKNLLAEDDLNNIVGYYKYLGVPLAICMDDYGQCYYFIFSFNGQRYENSCGTYNMDYEDDVMDCIDSLYIELN